MKSFSKFILESQKSYGITHVEDLPVEEFIRAIKNLDRYHVVQKLDGANLLAGRDVKGRLYTSREQKGGRRFYKESDFDEVSAMDGFKAAHAVIIKNQTTFEEHVRPGQEINMEVIYGAQPNTVFYGKDSLNYIGLLEFLPGDDPSLEGTNKQLKELSKALGDKITTVKTISTDSWDGETMVRAPRISDWKFTTSDIVPKEDIQALEIQKEVRDLEKYLDSQNETAEILGKDFTNFEVLKDRSRDLGDERKEINQIIFDEYKAPIKEKLLQIVYKQIPSLRGEIDDEGSYEGIEGIIFTDLETKEKFKVVDREIFTAINKFNYGVRNGLSSKIVSTDVTKSIDSRGGIVGEAKIRAIKLLGITSAEIPSQTKKTLEPFKGEDRDETISNLIDSLHQLNFTAIRKKIQAIYVNALDDVEDSLIEFKKTVDDFKLDLPNGRQIKYTKEIRHRTLLSFADTKENIYSILSKIKNADELPDLVEIFFCDQLDALHQNDGKITK